MEEQNVYVELRKLPTFSALNDKVKEVERAATWWETYGTEWVHVGGALLAAGLGLLLLRDGGVVNSLCGVFLLGAFHSILTQRAGHLAAHGSLVRSKAWNRFWAVTMVEFLGSYSEHMGTDIHIRQHHPHTNIIGLGDSSSWKMPGIPGLLYLYAAPLALPPLAPLVAAQQLVETGAYWGLVRFIPVVVAGVVLRALVFIHVCGFSVLGALLVQWAYQAVFAIPYIHFNVFQHIGLPMYSVEKRPARIYQMATGVLNLDRNPLLDVIFGHALINCHVEHHLFPRLSDSLCLKVKPLVRKYLLEHGLPYNEKSYWDRLCTFTKGYQELMVKAPPITHFIGIQ